MKWIIGLVVVLLLAVGGGLCAWHTWQDLLARTTLPLGAGDPQIEVAEGDTALSVGQRLIASGRLDMPSWAWRLYLRTRASNAIQRGEYALEPGLSAAELIDRAVRGDVVRYRLTLVEGATFEDVRAVLRAAPRLRQVVARDDDATLMARLERPDEHPEGQFFPDTYVYTAADSDLGVLRQAAERMQQVLASAWEQRAPDLALETPGEALVLASIIEKETGQAAERAQIAGVFQRRLQRGMRLQTDPTVIYGLGEAFDGNLTRSHLKTDQPYNTYTRRGLPPTPICMPSLASIQAALAPADGDALYFVARGDGSSQFSATLDEHVRAVREFQLARQ